MAGEAYGDKQAHERVQHKGKSPPKFWVGSILRSETRASVDARGIRDYGFSTMIASACVARTTTSSPALRLERSTLGLTFRVLDWPSSETVTVRLAASTDSILPVICATS